MRYAITVRRSDPGGDNEPLEEALSILNAKRLKDLKRGQQFLASTPYPLAHVLRLLLRSTKGDDDVEILELPIQNQTRVEQSKAG